MRKQFLSVGMTLIEVLAAVAILGTGLTFLLSGAAQCLIAIKKAQYYQEVQWTLAMGEADHPLVRTNDLSALEVSGERYDNGFTFSRWVEEDEVKDGLFEIRTRVTWSQRGKEAFDEVAMLMFIPEVEEEE